MLLSELRIENLRCYRDETIRFSPLSIFLGPNGSGKSTILTALNILFRESTNAQTDLLNLSEEDFHNRDTGNPIRITATFSDLSEDAAEEFKGYVRQGKLIVTAEAKFNADAMKAEVTQYGQRLGMKEFAQFFAKVNDGEPVGNIKPIYLQLKQKHESLPNWQSKDKAIAALHDFESEHAELCEAIPSKDQFYGYTKGINRLEKFIQWVYVPAVKDALAESLESKGGALAKLLARTVRINTTFSDGLEAIKAKALEEYAKILGDNEAGLHELGEALTERLKEWAHPEASIDLRWNVEAAGAVSIKEPLAQVVAGEGEFTGQLSRLGHGFQRSYIIALLQELAAKSAEGGPRMLLACEEPELYQHPPQSRHLASVFHKLSQGNNQVLVCTHSPHFIPSDDLNSLQVVNKSPTDGSATVTKMSYEDLSERLKGAGCPDHQTKPAGLRAKLHQQLQPQLNEMFFCNVPVLVEGLEDVAYLSSGLLADDLWEEFRRLGCHFIHADGKDKLIRPLAVCKGLGLKPFVVWDADDDEVKDERRKHHERDNLAIQRLLDIEKPNAFPQSNVLASDHAVWRTKIGDTYAEETAHDNREQIVEEIRKQHGQQGGLEKNPLFIGDVVLTLAENGIVSDTLRATIKHILTHAAKVREGK